VEWYRDSKLALERLEQLAGDPAYSPEWLPVVVFADLRMPTLDGISLVRMIRSRPDLSAVPVVLLSSSNNPEEIRAAYAAGANAFVTKPTDFHFYAECLHLALAFWGRCNRVAWSEF
jgi:CheY-like chemotaxis protein